MAPFNEVAHIYFVLVVVSLAERSKAPDSSSGGAIRVGSNPTAVIFIFGFVAQNNNGPTEKHPPIMAESAVV